MLTPAADSQTAGTRHPGLDGLQVPERSSGSWGLSCVVFGFSLSAPRVQVKKQR